ncbi:MAG: alpha-amylase [Rhodospirillales bacterium]|nr:alpha-amylase [Rhodospirillales bacterium]
MPTINGTMMQAFHWDYPDDGRLWDELAANADALAAAGFTALWLPSPCKAMDGPRDVGYATYDLFDLGEFDQKGAVRTKYGTRAQLTAAVQAMHQASLQVYLDTVFNHKGGADGTEVVSATPVSSDNRNIDVGPARDIEAWTQFTFPGRGATYSGFQWHWYHFDAVDFDQRTGDRSLFRLRDKTFDTPVDPERGNYDYLMFDDLDMDRDEIRAELRAWGDWILQALAVDGFRLDAVKHIRFPFFVEWLDHVRTARSSLFAVGEYFTGNVATLRWFIEQTGRRMALFDFPLQFAMRDLGRASGGLDMRQVFNGTLVAQDPELAVTFIDNHDTHQQNRQDDAVPEWFRPHAYALILLREGGYPCVFYPDYYGGGGRTAMRSILDALLAARRDHAYGQQTDYLDDGNVIGWTRAGDTDHPNGLAVVMSDGPGGSKTMQTGRPNTTFAEVVGTVGGTVTTDAGGNGAFRCNDRTVSVWIAR